MTQLPLLEIPDNKSKFKPRHYHRRLNENIKKLGVFMGQYTKLLADKKSKVIDSYQFIAKSVPLLEKICKLQEWLKENSGVEFPK